MDYYEAVVFSVTNLLDIQLFFFSLSKGSCNDNLFLFCFLTTYFSFFLFVFLHLIGQIGGCFQAISQEN